MKYGYSISKPKTFNFDQIAKIFPGNFSIQQEDEEAFIIVETEENSESEVFKQVQRECDRIFFLTGEQPNPLLRRKPDSDGITTCLKDIKNIVIWKKGFPKNIVLQEWDRHLGLAVQLRLWQASKLTNLPIVAKIILLFQIIEIDYPNTNDVTYYPVYSDISKDPEPRTEALLLRNWVSHGSTKQIKSTQLEDYCNHLNIRVNFHNCTDLEQNQILKERVNLIEKQAQEIINEKITLVKEK